MAKNKKNSTHVAQLDAAIANLTSESRVGLAEEIQGGGLGETSAEATFAAVYEALPEQLKAYALFQLQNYVAPEPKAVADAPTA